MNTAKKLTKTSMVYLFGQVASKLITFFLLPLYTYNISTSDFGYFDLSVTYMMVAVPVMCIEVWSGMLRFGLSSEDKQYKRDVVDNSIIILILGMAAFSIGFLLSVFVFHFDWAGYIYFYAITWMAQLILSYACRAYNKDKLFAVTGIISVLVQALSALLFVIVFHIYIEGLYLSAILGFVVQVVIIEIKLKVLRDFRFTRYNKDIFTTLVRFCAPLAIASVFHWMLSNFNRVVLQHYLGLEANGIYAVANKLTFFITMLVTVFYLAWQELTYSIPDRAEREKKYNQALNWFVRLVGAGSVLLLPVTNVVFPYLIGKDYQSAFLLIPAFYLSTFVTSIAGLTATCFSAENKTSQLVYSKIFGGIVNLIVLFALLKPLGLMSSPIALFFGQTTVVLVQHFQLNKFIRIHFEWKPLVHFTVFYLIAAVVYFKGSPLINILCALLIGAAYLLMYRKFIFDFIASLRSKD